MIKETEWIIQIDNYNEYVELSKARREKYFKKGDKIPNKYNNPKTQNVFDKDGYLLSWHSGKRIVKNPIAAGTPKRWKVAGQCLYNGTMHPHSRNKASSEIHQYLRPYIKPLPKLLLGVGEYLAIGLEIHNVVGKGDWDVSNKWPWIKWFEDTLVESKKIPDDSVQYVRDSGGIKFFETVDITYIPKLIFKIHKINSKHERI